MKRRTALIILIVALVLVTIDSFTTNYLIGLGCSELNPIVRPIAGTIWLPIVKIGWVLIFLIPILFVKNKRVL